MWATSAAVPADRDSSAMAVEDSWPTGSSRSRASSDFPDEGEKYMSGPQNCSLIINKSFNISYLGKISGAGWQRNFVRPSRRERDWQRICGGIWWDVPQIVYISLYTN